MGTAKPLLDGVRDRPETSNDPATDAAGKSNIEWLDRIIGLTAGRDTAVASAPSVDALLADPELPSGFAVPAPPVTGITLTLDRVHLGAAPARRCVDPDGAARLAASIAEQGILQPLLVRPKGDDFEVVAGARRLQSARLAGLHEVPVVVLDLSDREALMVALVENLQREDVSAIDEAQCYFRLLDDFDWTQDELARRVGRSRSHIGNTLRLLGLPASVREQLENGTLSAGHARALFNSRDPDALVATVIAHGLSVRETEALVRRQATATKPARPRLSDRQQSAFEHSVAKRLGLMVRLQSTKRGGKITIYYNAPDELEAALRAYGRMEHDHDDAVAPAHQMQNDGMPA